jgi:ABC-2 type transport system ATP-binding protein
MPEAVPLYPEMRVVEYLRFRAELKRVPRADRTRFVDDAMGAARVLDVATRPIGKLSKGYRQRVGLADALVAKPPILILDEPTAGLDPNQIRDVRAVVRDLGKDHTILLSTHILSEVEASCGRVILIDKGKLVAQGPTDEIRKMRRTTSLDLVVRGDAAVAEKTLGSVEGVAKVERTDDRDGVIASFRCALGRKLREDGRAEAIERAVAALVAAGLHVREARPAGGSLEEVFAALTKADEDADGDAGDDGTSAPQAPAAAPAEGPPRRGPHQGTAA